VQEIGTICSCHVANAWGIHTSTGAIPEGFEKAAIAFQCDLTQISPNSRRETIVPR